jgi:hypothetical protein
MRAVPRAFVPSPAKVIFHFPAGTEVASGMSFCGIATLAMPSKPSPIGKEPPFTV